MLAPSEEGQSAWLGPLPPHSRLQVQCNPYGPPPLHARGPAPWENTCMRVWMRVCVQVVCSCVCTCVFVCLCTCTSHHCMHTAQRSASELVCFVGMHALIQRGRCCIKFLLYYFFLLGQEAGLLKPFIPLAGQAHTQIHRNTYDTHAFYNWLIQGCSVWGSVKSSDLQTCAHFDEP